jgi:DNA polymerase (family 10)
MHTDRTDGREDLETMVLAAKKRGYEYVAITDHSKSNVMMGGFDEARVKKSAKEIEAVGKKVRGIEVLNGLEVDILRNGSLDLDDDGLEVLDLVIVSLHSGLDDDEKKSTKRVLKALSHPSVQIMGHPTGRLIGKRAGAPFDMEKALDFAAERGIAMEINAQPNRQDLSDVNARLAKEKGVRISINTDAHSIPQLDNMKFGVFVARRAGLTKDDVLNTMPFAEFQKALRRSWKAGPSTAAAKRKTAARKKAAPRKKAAKR